MLRKMRNDYSSPIKFQILIHCAEKSYTFFQLAEIIGTDSQTIKVHSKRFIAEEMLYCRKQKQQGKRGQYPFVLFTTPKGIDVLRELIAGNNS